MVYEALMPRFELSRAGTEEVAQPAAVEQLDDGYAGRPERQQRGPVRWRPACLWSAARSPR